DSPAAAWGAAAARDPRWPASLAVAVAVALTVTLPDPLVLYPRWILPAVEAVMVIPLTVAAPFRHHNEPSWVRLAGLVLIAVVEAANLASLTLLVNGILAGNAKATGHTLVVAAVQIYLTNIAVFALWFWELDRGGPGARMRSDHRQPDFLFPQMMTPDSAPAGWTPGFVDYLYVAFTNATAFSPTDTMPLTPTAKSLMSVESLAALLTVAVVAARAINILH
ncbi:MAG: hypothetical protein ACRD0J_02300, partial [Acidimicrobiales bacterium]